MSANESLVSALQDEYRDGNIVGLNLATGEPMDPIQEGVFDSFRVLRNYLASSTGIASNLLLCDELLKARQMVRHEISKLLEITTDTRDRGRKAAVADLEVQWRPKSKRRRA